MSTEGAHAAAAAAQLLDVLGEAAVHWPAGDQTAAVDVTVLVDRTEQASEFAAVNMPGTGKGIPRQAKITLRTSVAVTVQGETTRVSVFVLEDGSKWFAEKQLSVEDGLQVIVCTSRLPIHTQEVRR